MEINQEKSVTELLGRGLFWNKISWNSVTFEESCLFGTILSTNRYINPFVWTKRTSLFLVIPSLDTTKMKWMATLTCCIWASFTIQTLEIFRFFFLNFKVERTILALKWKVLTLGQESVIEILQIAQVSSLTSQLHIITWFHFFSLKMISSSSSSSSFELKLYRLHQFTGLQIGG